MAAYLDIDGIIGIAKEKGVDAIHPGYGFLSENAEFARACRKAGIIFVGPRPELLDMMGDKTAARAVAKRIGVSTLPGTEEPVSDRHEALKVAQAIGFPDHQGRFLRGRRPRDADRPQGGRTWRPSWTRPRERPIGPSEIPRSSWKNTSPRSKHIEVQVLGDQHGNLGIHLHERDCSVQRGGHQKVVEVAPSFGLPESVITELCEAAARMAREVRYDNAGTIEFLYDLDHHEWFFIEMNPRIQVEHTVTEVITGLDLVRAQILIAQGHPLHSSEVSDAAPKGRSEDRLRDPGPDHDGGSGQ